MIRLIIKELSITIIIDKSTFQLLNFSELWRVSHYYKHNITPILTMEVLGDLRKEFKDSNKPPEDRVKDFANKLFPVETIVNRHYKDIVVEDLLGNHFSFDGRPYVGIQKAVKSETGQRGFIIEETQEEKAIYKWKEGFFTEADHILSSLWREATTQEDLLKNLKESLQNEHAPVLKTYEELYHYSLTQTTKAENQQNLLLAVVKNYALHPTVCVEIFSRWIQEGKPLIKDFAPYAFHCLMVDILFLNGLACGLIDTKPTNKLDMEYVYYLPFCNVFTSNDKIHKRIVPLLLFPYQRFIVGEDLKKDLKGIVEHIDKLGEDEKKNFAKNPPILDDSLTFKLWKEHFNYPDGSSFKRVISQKEKDYMLEKMKEFSRATEGETISLNPDDAEFIVRKSYLSINDVCYCGSGKKIVDCCLPGEKFMLLAREEKKRQIKPLIEDSYSKANHVRFTTYSDEDFPAILMVYHHENINIEGHLGLITYYKHGALTMTGRIDGRNIRLSFVEIESGNTIDLKPLPCSPKQVEMFMKGSHDEIALQWGLTNPREKYGVIIPTSDDGKVNQLLIKGFSLVT